MANTTPAEDPRSIVTPDAFKVSGDLLGLPLASPRRRLVAILLDLLLIAILSQLGGTALAVTAAIFFFFLARRGKGSRPSRGGRILVGCLGLLFVTVAVPAVIGIVALLRGDGVRIPPSTPEPPASSASPAFLLQSIGDVIRLGQAGSPQEALQRAEGVAERAREMDVPEADLEAFLLEVLPDSAWSPGVVAQVMAGQPAAGGAGVPGGGGGAVTPGEPDPAAGEAQGVAAEVEAPAAPGAVTQATPSQAEVPGAGAAAGAGEPEAAADPTASDSLAALQETIRSLERRNEQLSGRVGTLQQELEAEREQEGFFLPFLTRIFEDLGLAFGFGTIYLTVFTAWWKGQTPGKRLLGVRVMRLDGKPITWWDAFERAGGYAAGFATGLLGFAQVLWDPNRQAIHDRVSSTVVIRAGAPRVPGRWATAEDVDPGRGVQYEFRKGEES